MKTSVYLDLVAKDNCNAAEMQYIANLIGGLCSAGYDVRCSLFVASSRKMLLRESEIVCFMPDWCEDKELCKTHAKAINMGKEVWDLEGEDE